MEDFVTRRWLTFQSFIDGPGERKFFDCLLDNLFHQTALLNESFSHRELN
jgi:hypothetical protein